MDYSNIYLSEEVQNFGFSNFNKTIVSDTSFNFTVSFTPVTSTENTAIDFYLTGSKNSRTEHSSINTITVYPDKTNNVSYAYTTAPSKNLYIIGDSPIQFSGTINVSLSSLNTTSINKNFTVENTSNTTMFNFVIGSE
jgi:hypothetical protein